MQYYAEEIHEKICPECGRYVEVFPEERWEIEFHLTSRFDGRPVKCSSSGQRLPEGKSRKRILMKVKKGD